MNNTKLGLIGLVALALSGCKGQTTGINTVFGSYSCTKLQNNYHVESDEKSATANMYANGNGDHMIWIGMPLKQATVILEECKRVWDCKTDKPMEEQ